MICSLKQFRRCLNIFFILEAARYNIVIYGGNVVFGNHNIINFEQDRSKYHLELVELSTTRCPRKIVPRLFNYCGGGGVDSILLVFTVRV